MADVLPGARQPADRGWRMLALALSLWGLIGQPWIAPRLQDFSCANLWPARLTAPGRWRELGLGMARYDISWGAVQPSRTHWTFDATDAALLEMVNSGVRVLPMLGYTPRWAWVREDYSFVEAGYRWEITVGPFDARRGLGPARCRRVSLRDGKVTEGEVGNLPPRRVADWQRFVDRVVARYSRPPYNIRCFQIWNEFNWPDWYHQTWQDFIDRIHIPAARIIRRYGCKVVFGGWACTAGPEELCRLLAYHEAWRYTDIIDFHYQQNRAFQVVYDAYVRDGRCLGIWETEIGWCPWKEYLINTYPRLLYWALCHEWDHPDKYKVFWFHFTSVSALHGLTYQDKPNFPLSDHGLALRTLAKMLPGPIRKWEGYSCRPALEFSLTEEEPSAEGFATRCSRVLVAHLGPDELRRGKLTVIARGLARSCREVMAVDRAGRKLDVQAESRGDDLAATVSLKQLQPAVWRFRVKGATVLIRFLTADTGRGQTGD